MNQGVKRNPGKNKIGNNLYIKPFFDAGLDPELGYFRTISF
jgi:hypothetical protein